MPRYHETGKVISQIGEHVDNVIAKGYEPVGVLLNMMAFLRLKKEMGHSKIGKEPFSLKFDDLLLPVFYTPPFYRGNSPITIMATKLVRFGNV